MHLKTDTNERQKHFSRVPTISHSRNAFSIAKKHVTTLQFDYLYPVYSKFIYPGDTVSITHECAARLATQVGTLYDDLYIDIHAWYVPMRLIQTNWSRYQFNDQPGGPSQDNSSLTSPSIDLSGLGTDGLGEKNLYDCLGFPTEADISSSGQHINNYEARAYNFIWNEDYRDQNLQNPVTVDLDEGPDDPTDYVLLKRGKRHDKFTSALTAQQKGVAATITLSGTAPVEPDGNNIRVVGDNSTNRDLVWNSTIGMTTSGSAGTDGTQIEFVQSGLEANLTAINVFSVNDIRTSIAIQHLLESDSRGGTRDVEAIQNRWGVTVPDFRLQRPEYLGGATYDFDGHIVPQTSATSGSNFQGDLVQFSQSRSSLNINHSFQEHGIMMILLSCRSNITYQQGLSRERSYNTRYDWFQPEFANLGEVAIKNKEINVEGDATDDETFGFQEYGYEMRYSDNMVTNEMRSAYATSKDSLHMADDYGGVTPTLGSTWIQSTTPIDRNITVASGTADPIEINMMTKGKIARRLPMYSIPGLYRI